MMHQLWLQPWTQVFKTHSNNKRIFLASGLKLRVQEDSLDHGSGSLQQYRPLLPILFTTNICSSFTIKPIVY